MLKENAIFRKKLSAIKGRLDKRNVRWAIFAGAAARCYGSSREITDVDILVCSQDLKKARNALKDIDIEGFDIGAGSEMKIGQSTCRFFLEDVPNEKTQWRKLFNIEVPVIPVEDNIIFKAMLQRGTEEDKHDVEDIRQMIQHERIDLEYLKRRIRECRCEKRVMPLLQTLISDL